MKMSSSSRIRGIERSSTTTSALRPMAMRAAFMPTTPPPRTATRAGGTPGTPQSSRPMPPLCLSRVSAAENTAMRPAAPGVGDGLVGDRRGAGGEQALGLGGVGRQVQVGEEDVVRLQPFPLDLLRLLHLDDQLRALEHGVGVRRDAGPGPDEGFVVVAGAKAGPGFDQNLMAPVDIFTDGGGGQTDPMLARFDLRGNAYAHGRFLLTLLCGEMSR